MGGGDGEGKKPQKSTFLREMKIRRFPPLDGRVLSTPGRWLIRCLASLPLRTSTASKFVRAAGRPARTQVRRRASKELRLDSIPGMLVIRFLIPGHTNADSVF